MANFFIDRENISGKMAYIRGEDAVHISRVLRMKKGDRVVLCDGEGMFYQARLTSFKESEVTAEIEDVTRAESEPDVKITLFQAIPKNPKLEIIVQKLTEIGAVRIVPVNTVRAVAKLEKESKNERLRKIAREAAKQSRRGIVPEIDNPINFEEAVKKAATYDLKIIAYEEEKDVSLKEVLRRSKPKKAAIMIGPEGGFDRSEVLLAEKNGIIPVTLGNRILRTETAGLVVCANILYEFN